MINMSSSDITEFMMNEFLKTVGIFDFVTGLVKYCENRNSKGYLEDA
jgi:hypothetical protein